MNDIVIKDEKGRDAMRVNGRGGIAIARYPDLSDKMKEYIIAVYGESTSGDVEELRKFLNYDGENNEFCS